MESPSIPLRSVRETKFGAPNRSSNTRRPGFVSSHRSPARRRVADGERLATGLLRFRAFVILVTQSEDGARAVATAVWTIVAVAVTWPSRVVKSTPTRPSPVASPPLIAVRPTAFTGHLRRCSSCRRSRALAPWDTPASLSRTWLHRNNAYRLVRCPRSRLHGR